MNSFLLKWQFLLQQGRNTDREYLVFNWKSCICNFLEVIERQEEGDIYLYLFRISGVNGELSKRILRTKQREQNYFNCVCRLLLLNWIPGARFVTSFHFIRPVASAAGWISSLLKIAKLSRPYWQIYESCIGNSQPSINPFASRSTCFFTILHRTMKMSSWVINQ